MGRRALGPSRCHVPNKPEPPQTRIVLDSCASVFPQRPAQHLGVLEGGVLRQMEKLSTKSRRKTTKEQARTPEASLKAPLWNPPFCSMQSMQAGQDAGARNRMQWFFPDEGLICDVASLTKAICLKGLCFSAGSLMPQDKPQGTLQLTFNMYVYIYIHLQTYIQTYYIHTYIHTYIHKPLTQTKQALPIQPR